MNSFISVDIAALGAPCNVRHIQKAYNLMRPRVDMEKKPVSD